MSTAVCGAIEAGGVSSDRRARILAAAEICFVRNGFDRTTMQDIAREAAMSPANLYRYFDSKEALVVGLVERERQGAIELLTRMQRQGDERAELLVIIDRYFGSLSREAAILRLGIWSEATRNPTIAALVARGEEESRAWFVCGLSRLATSPACDPSALYARMATIMRGIIVSRALVPDHDPAPMVAHLRAVMETGLAGRPLAPFGTEA